MESRPGAGFFLPMHHKVVLTQVSLPAILQDVF
jgi:hypothetical protein